MANSRATSVLIFYDKPQEFLPTLEQRFSHARFSTCTRYKDLDETLAREKPDIALACKFEPQPFPRQAFVNCPSLKWLSVAFAGVDHVVPWDDEKLVVTNASGVAAKEMAEYTVAAIFGLFQRFPYFAKKQAEKCWDYQMIRSASGSCVGLIGVGKSGATIAEICKKLDFKTLAYRSRLQPDANIDHVYTDGDLYEMLAQCDVVVVCAALTPATRGMIDSQAINAMKHGAYLINISRGAIVEERALICALESGQLGGAVIDVACTEPLPVSDPLWDAPNLFITPHTSSEYEGWQAKAADMFAENFDRWEKDEPLLNRVFSNRGY
jgi:phosphoglycerate dehydrogenase-like enzyme